MEDEGNSSLLPPSDIKSKKEQPEMLSEFDRRFRLLLHFDIETIPLRMLPPLEAETFCGKDDGDRGNHTHGLHPTRLEKGGEGEKFVSRRKREEEEEEEEEGRGGEEGQTTSPPRCGAEEVGGFVSLLGLERNGAEEVQENTPNLAIVEDSSTLPPSDTKIKKEQQEMLRAIGF
ncbi:hypothetical protein ACE6H2_021516 [Prunus campanulata]